jgi:hypothetical protein
MQNGQEKKNTIPMSLEGTYVVCRVDIGTTCEKRAHNITLVSRTCDVERCLSILDV